MTETPQDDEVFASIFNAMPDGFAYCRMLFDEQKRPVDFIFLKVNGAFNQITELCNVVGKCATEVIPEINAAAPEIIALFGRVVLTGRPEKMESFISPLLRRLSLSVTPATGDCFAVIFQDVRENKRSELGNEARFQAIINASPVPTAAHDDLQNVTLLNPAFVQLFGYTAVDIPRLADWWSKAYPNPAYLRRVVSDWQVELERAKRSGTAFTPMEVTVRCKSGIDKIVLVSAAPFFSSCGRSDLVVFHDITERKKVDLALRESEQRFSAFFRSNLIAAGISEVGTGIFLDVNDAFLNMFGYTREEVLGHTSAELRLWAIPEERELAFRSLDSQQNLEQKEVKFRHKSGTLGDALVSVEFIGINGQRYMFGVLKDVTKRRQAEEALRLSRAKLDIALASTTDALFVSDANGTLSEFNDAFVTFFRFKSKEDCPKTLVECSRLLDVFMADGKLAPAEMWAVPRALRGETVTNAEYGLRRKDTGESWTGSCSANPIRDETGNIVGAVVVARDITEQKKVEVALLENEAKLRAIFENTPDGILFTSPDSSVTSANPAACEILGWSADEICSGGRNLVLDSSDPRVLPALEQRAQTGQFRGELRFKKKTGVVFPVELATKVFPFGAGISKACIIFRDITERKQAEAEKQKLEVGNRLLQKSESLSRMASAIAHHFNNQLQAVMMGQQLALRLLPKDAEPSAILADAMLAARKAAEVSKLMLIYLGQTHEEHHAIDIVETCQRQLPMLKVSMPPGLILHVHLPSESLAIHSNADQIQQILTNLLTNAWEACGDQQGTIHLTVKTVLARNLSSVNRFPIDCALEESLYACFEVTDTGLGIASQDIERVFDPFFSTKFEGRGLGLAVVLGIAKAHRGAVAVESLLGQGSTFRVFLPLSAEPLARNPVPAPPRQAPVVVGTVLVVEDDPLTRRAVTFALRHSGFSVLTAVDGVEAVEIFQQHGKEISCVLCDLTMPRMNGWETLAALRKLSPGIPVILSSGYSEAQMLKGQQNERPQALLTKPCELNLLYNTILQAMNEGKGGQAEGESPKRARPGEA